MAKTAWRCSQCGTVNEPAARACASCGKWPSLFDLQDDVVGEKGARAGFRDEAVEPEVFEPEVYETGSFEPEVFEGDEEKGAEGRRSRFPRWAVTAIWVIGVLVWILVNALADR